MTSPSAALAEGEWSEVPLLRMPGRAGHVAVLDDARSRVVIFGGYDSYDEFKNDTWALDLTNGTGWEPIAPAGPIPPGRYFHSAILDPVRERLIVFGGYDGNIRNDVWALSLSGTPAWTELMPTGTAPTPRWGHAAVYDPAGDRMILIGGAGAPGNLNDVWALSLGGTPSWTQLTPSGEPPSPRRQHAAAFDAAGNRVVVIGGNDGSLRNDVWVLTLSGAPVWSMMSPVGIAPTGRRGHVAVYEPTDGAIVVFGGFDGDYRADVHTLSVTGSGSWSIVSPAGVAPVGRYAAVAVFDASLDRMIICGGDDGPARRDDVWALALSGSPSWSDATPMNWPAARWGHAAAFDSRRNRMLVVGGAVAPVLGVNDVWAFALDGEPAWSLIPATGDGPTGRRQHSAIVDAARDRLIVFGGLDGALRNDVWALSLRPPYPWIRLTPTGTPPTARRGHCAVYDAARDRMIVFGGYDDRYLSDVWALNLGGAGNWLKLVPSVAQPSPRYCASAIIDPVRDRLVVFGGDTGPARVNDAWALPLGFGSSWSRIETSSQPGIRAGHSGVYDAARDRLIVFGGYNAYATFLNDTWSLSLSGTPAWTNLSPAGDAPPGCYFHAAVQDPIGDRMVVFGGYSSGAVLEDLWLLEMNEVSAQATESQNVVRSGIDERRDSVELRVVGANIIRRAAGATLEFAVPEPGVHASLRVYDVSGRCIAILHQGWIAGGIARREIAHDLQPLAPGIYFLRLDTRLGGASERITLLP